MKFMVEPCKVSFSGALSKDELEDVQFYLNAPSLNTAAERVQDYTNGRRILRLMFVDAALRGSITTEG